MPLNQRRTLMNKTLLLATLLCLFNLNCYCTMKTDNAPSKKPETKFPLEWTLDLKASPYNITAVTEGKLYDKEGNVFYSFHNDHYSDLQKTVPYKVSLTWLSYPDKQFYEATFPLPGDTIAALLQSGSGYPESDKEPFEASDRTYSPYRFEDIRLLLSLDGTVHVKMRSSFNIIEVAQAQARKVTAPASFHTWLGAEDKRDAAAVVDDFYQYSEWPNADYYRKYGGEKLRRFFCPQRYRYNLSISLPAITDTLTTIENHYNNGDILTYRYEELTHVKNTIYQGVPKQFYVFWGDASLETNALQIEFEREYIRSLFEDNIPHNAPWSLAIRIIETEEHQIEIVLTDGTRVIPVELDKVKFTFYKNQRSTYCNIPIGEKDRDIY